MSDVLLTRIAVALEAIAAGGGKVAAAPAAGPKPGTAAGAGAGASSGGAAPTAAAKAAAAKAADDKKKADAAKIAAAAKGAGPAAGTKGPGGKYTIEQVRDMIRKVATDPSLGKQSAADILADDGGGVTKVTDLKPENYDKVYEACQVILTGEGGGAAAEAPPEDDLM